MLWSVQFIPPVLKRERGWAKVVIDTKEGGAQVRKTVNINKGWRFTGPDGPARPVDVPHTWNSVDGQDGGNDYWRGTCVYEKTFPRPELEADERVYLEFRGVNASAKVELNGAEVGTHDGGYSTFRWDVTDFLKDENEIGRAHV